MLRIQQRRNKWLGPRFGDWTTSGACAKRICCNDTSKQSASRSDRNIATSRESILPRHPMSLMAILRKLGVHFAFPIKDNFFRPPSRAFDVDSVPPFTQWEYLCAPHQCVEFYCWEKRAVGLPKHYDSAPQLTRFNVHRSESWTQLTTVWDRRSVNAKRSYPNRELR